MQLKITVNKETYISKFCIILFTFVLYGTLYIYNSGDGDLKQLRLNASKYIPKYIAMIDKQK